MTIYVRICTHSPSLHRKFGTQNSGHLAKLKPFQFFNLCFLGLCRDMILLVHCISLCSMLSLASFRYSRLSATKYRN